MATVTGISTSAGPAAGGTTVTITGAGFTLASAVNFGATPAINVVIVSDTQLTATSPPGTGTVNITVVTPGGASRFSAADQFTYGAAPVVTGVSPDAGSITGGTTVTIAGTNLGISGFLTLDDPAGVEGTYITGIQGTTVVGYYQSSSGLDNGFIYNGSSFTTLDDPAGVKGTCVTGISGPIVVGYYLDSNGFDNGFTYNGSSFTTIDDPGGESTFGTFVTGVSGGTVIGWYPVKTRVGSMIMYLPTGFVYNGSSFTTLSDAGDPTTPTGISGGTIVGYYYPSHGSEEGFKYNGSAFTTVDDPAGDTTGGTCVNGIGGGTIVGDVADSSGSNGNGFIYDGSSFTPLNDPAGVDGTYPSGVSGTTVVGSYQDSNGLSHGFLQQLACHRGLRTLADG